MARGIEPEHFDDLACEKTYEFLVEHVKQYKIPPSLQTVQEELKAKKIIFNFEVSPDALDYLTDRFVGLIKYRATAEAVRDISQITADPRNWENLDLEMLEIASNLAKIVPSSQISKLSDVKKRIEAYEKRKAEGNPWGIKIGIPSLDALTMGVQSHELVSIAGWMGLGKSTLCQFILFNSYLQDKKPMMISGEMEAEALFRKWDTMATNMSYKALKALELGKGDMKKWEEWGEKASDTSADRDIIVIDDIGRLTVEKVFAETVRYNPDLVAVDYIGLMEAPSNVGSTWEKITYCTKGLKQNARNLKVPIISVAQTNREDGGSGAELGKLAGSLSIGRDSDQVIGMYQDEEMLEAQRMEVRLLKSRDSGQGTAQLKWKPDIGEYGEIPPSEFFSTK